MLTTFKSDSYLLIQDLKDIVRKILLNQFSQTPGHKRVMGRLFAIPVYVVNGALGREEETENLPEGILR